MTDISTVLNEIEQLATSGNVEDAIRLSGEELARWDNAWRKAHNSRLPVESVMTSFAALALAHADLLFRAGAWRDAYATAVTAMMSLSVDRQCMANASEMLGLLTVALAALEQIAAKIEKDSFTETHIPVMISYLASLLYFYYRHTWSSGQSQWHGRAYPLLRDMTEVGAVRSPHIPVANPDGTSADVDPSDPAPLFSDLAGRSVALGLLSQ